MQAWRIDIAKATLICAILLGMTAPFAIVTARASALQIERISLTVSDLGRTEAFYRDGLGFRTVARRSVDDPEMQRLLGVSKTAETLTMQLGREEVDFVQYQTPGREYPAGSQSPDLWFQHFAVVVADMEAAYMRLRGVAFVPISTDGPETLPEEDGSVRAFKFRDPDGHPLELIYFPPGQGRATWRAAGPGQVALGIDHTAISVSDGPTSIAFYQALLGMKIIYEIVNRGPTQERLDGTAGAVVHITGLRPMSSEGPGIELLEYRLPRSGRRPPADARADDAWHAHVVLRVDALDETVAAFGGAGVPFISPGIVGLGNGVRAAEVVDPDGHPILVEQR